jgi:hypothetical protein
MTKYEAAVISAFTGVMVCEFSDMKNYIQKLTGRLMFDEEFGGEENFIKIKELARNDFMNLEIVDEIKYVH